MLPFFVVIIIKVLCLLFLILFAIRFLRRHHRYTHFYQYLFFCRFPIVFGLFLIAFPFLVLSGALQELLGNLLELDVWGNGVVAFFAVFTSWVVLFTLTRTLELTPIKTRLDFVRAEAGCADLKTLSSNNKSFRWLYKLSALVMDEKDARLKRLLFAGTLALPLIVVTIYNSSKHANSDWLDLLFNTGGALAGVALAFIIRWVYSPLENRDRRQERGFRPFDQAIHSVGGLFEKWGQVILKRLIGIDIDDLEPMKGQYVLERQALAIFFVLIVGALYFLGLFLTGPRLLDSIYGLIPALVLIMLVHWIYCFVLSLLAVAFDSSRLPVMTTFVLFITLFYFALETDYTYDIEPVDEVPEAEVKTSGLSPYEAAMAWRENRGANADQMIVVAASGGGIAASQWTAEVLTRLDEGMYPDFRNGLALLSTTSGGSTGAMYYSDRFTDSAATREKVFNEVRSSASRSSLTAAIRGMVYGDIWRFVPVLHALLPDRGNALEDILEQRLVHPETLVLKDWADEVAAGERPAHVFNATMTETGSLMMISPVQFEAPYFQFSDVYKGFDIKVATAARLSATFPVTSPQARPSRSFVDTTAYHLSDGGYFDNYGLLGAIAYVDEVYKAAKDSSTIESLPQKVVLVLIEAFEKTEKKAQPESGWKFAFLGPLFTIYNMRDAAQRTRGEVEKKMFTRLMASEYDVDVETVTFTLKDIAVPLSWHLSKSNRMEISCVWSKQADNFNTIEEILGMDPAKASFIESEVCSQQGL